MTSAVSADEGRTRAGSAACNLPVLWQCDIRGTVGAMMAIETLVGRLEYDSGSYVRTDAGNDVTLHDMLGLRQERSHTADDGPRVRVTIEVLE